jgi:hypothetical protein
VLVKFSVVVAGPVIVGSWLKPEHRIWFAAGLSMIGTLVVTIYFTGFNPGTGTAGPIAGITRNTPWDWVMTLADGNADVRKIVLAFCYSGAIATMALIITRHPLDTPGDVVDAIALGLAVFIFCFAPTLRHWYQIWALPVLAVSSRRWLLVAGLAFTLGAFVPILTLNWNLTIESQLNIGAPVEVAVAWLWLITMAAGFVAWRMMPREPAATRAARRRDATPAQRSRARGRPTAPSPARG